MIVVQFQFLTQARMTKRCIRSAFRGGAFNTVNVLTKVDAAKERLLRFHSKSELTLLDRAAAPNSPGSQINPKLSLAVRVTLNKK